MSNILRAYTTPGNPVAFSGAARVKKYFTDRTSSAVEQELEKHEGFTKFRKKPASKNVNPYFVYYKRRQIQMDLIDVSKLSQSNDGIKFLCVAIDSFTKKAAVIPQKNKTAVSTLRSIKQIFEQKLKPPPETVIFDEGKEFKNRLVSSYLKTQRVENWDALTSDHKAAIAERFNLTLQNLIYQFLSHNKTLRYIDHLDELVLTYNSRLHRTIKMSPAQAELEENQHLVRRALGEKYGKLIAKHKPPRYKVGEMVRIRKYKTKFSRGYLPSFTDEVFQIVAVHQRMPFDMYTLQALNDDEPIRGSFYESDMQRYTGPI